MERDPATQHPGTNPTMTRRHALSLWLPVLLSANAVTISQSSRAYPLGCSQETSSYYDYDNYPFPPPGVPVKSTNDYNIIERLGNGKFSDVFSAIEVGGANAKDVSPTGEIDPHSLVVIKVSLWKLSCPLSPPLNTSHQPQFPSALFRSVSNQSPTARFVENF